jgi:hypothetical protein
MTKHADVIRHFADKYGAKTAKFNKSFKAIPALLGEEHPNCPISFDGGIPVAFVPDAYIIYHDLCYILIIEVMHHHKNWEKKLGQWANLAWLVDCESWWMEVLVIDAETGANYSILDGDLIMMQSYMEATGEWPPLPSAVSATAESAIFTKLADQMGLTHIHAVPPPLPREME